MSIDMLTASSALVKGDSTARRLLIGLNIAGYAHDATRQ